MTNRSQDVDQSDAAIVALGELLARVGYRKDRITALAGVADLRQLNETDLVPVQQRLADGGPLGILVELFYLGLPQPRALLDRTFPDADLDAWIAAGVVQPQDDSLEAQVVLMPHMQLVLIADRPPAPDRPLAPDYVMDVGGGTDILSLLAVRDKVERALDLGTGGGVLALLLSDVASEVVGVDINPRALTFARQSALLNGVTNARFEQADAFSLPPELADPPYELVTFHTPFVISPSANFEYCDTSYEGDECCRLALEAAARLLAEGGFAQLVVNWAQLRCTDWKARLSAWLEPTGCDAWILDSGAQEPAEYAYQWLVDECVGSQQRARLQAQWLEHYDRLGIEAIYSGVITLRRRSPAAHPNWFRFDPAPDRIKGLAGHHVRRIFAAQDLLGRLADDEALSRCCLVPPADLRIEKELKPVDGRWEVERCRSRLEGGLGFSIEHDPAVATLVEGCDGDTELGQVIQRLAQQLGASSTQLAPQVLHAVRTLINLGLLVASER